MGDFDLLGQTVAIYVDAVEHAQRPEARGPDRNLSVDQRRHNGVVRGHSECDHRGGVFGTGGLRGLGAHFHRGVFGSDRLYRPK